LLKSRSITVALFRIEILAISRLLQSGNTSTRHLLGYRHQPCQPEACEVPAAECFRHIPEGVTASAATRQWVSSVRHHIPHVSGWMNPLPSVGSEHSDPGGIICEYCSLTTRMGSVFKPRCDYLFVPTPGAPYVTCLCSKDGTGWGRFRHPRTGPYQQDAMRSKAVRSAWHLQQPSGMAARRASISILRSSAANVLVVPEPPFVHRWAFFRCTAILKQRHAAIFRSKFTIRARRHCALQ